MLPIDRWVIWILGFAFGSCVGSFLNVCIYRIPREQSLVRPGSRCPSCRRRIAPYDNIPILSYLWLRARCRRCGKRISWRYPVVEALTGFSTVAVLWRFGLGVAGAVYLALVCALIVSSFIDLEFQIIPDEISLGGLGVGVLASVLWPWLQGTDERLLALGRSVVGLLVGGGLLYVTGMLGDWLFRKESMGGGDIKLLAMAGSILGGKLVAAAFFLAPFFAMIPGLFVLIFKRSHVIPYGPFLSLAVVASLFYGNELLRVSGMEETARLLWEYYGWR